MNAILSVKPEYAKKILSGEKTFEYRKVVFKQPVEKVYIYATSPVRMIVGEFQIDRILRDSPKALWNITHGGSGVTQSFFNRYFKGKSLGYALRLKEVIAYSVPLSPFSLREDFKAPQNYIYVK